MAAERAARSTRIEQLRTVLLYLAAAAFVLAGVNHFRMPAFYLDIIPPQLPYPEALNAISGAAEIAGGLGLLIPPLRRAAGWGLLILLIAIFPANLYAALRGSMAGVAASPTALWLRLPFQAVFIAWVWWVSIAKRPTAR